MTAQVGDVLAGKYRVDKVLGIGGMGMVVAATHLELDQKVALKFMLDGAKQSTAAMDRFLLEARAAVRLRSEHICRVLDVGKLESGAPYIVLEYMEGRDFSDVLAERGPLAIDVTIDHVLQALEGIAEAHANGIVHRDLKPGNLFVTSDHTGAPLVKVLDFGISKVALASDGGGAATKTGDIMGSPSYMAPEQMASAKHVDARADLWAVGVILYEALTGKLPFAAESLPALCMSVMTDTPAAPRTIKPALPVALDAAIMRCLAKEPAGRFADLGELAAALAPFASIGARDRAQRVSRALRKSTTGAGGEVEASSSSPPTPGAATLTASYSAPPERSSPLPAIGAISTLQGSAAELTRAPRATSRRLLWIGSGVALVAALAVAGVTLLGGDRTPSTSAAAQPATPPPPLPAAAGPVDAAAAPLVETPPPPDTQTVAVEPVAPMPEPPKVEPSPVKKSTATRPRPTPATTASTPAAVPPTTKPPEPTPTPTPTTTPTGRSKWTKMQYDKKTTP